MHTRGMGHHPYGRYYSCAVRQIRCPAVNHIYYVYLRWGYVFRDMGGLLWLGNMVFVLEAISKGVGVFGVQFDDLDA